MADSDEEGDSRKSRDKFKRERSDYGDKYRKDASKDDNPRRRSRDYRNEGGRHDFSPPHKRMRRDNWEGFGGPYEQMPRMPWGSREPPLPQQSRTAMMSFKQFLAQQDDSIEDKEAVEKYNDYKKDVKKKQLQLFFDKHKEEEWFCKKYHPAHKSQQKLQDLADYKSRHEAYSTLQDQGLLKDVPLCATVSGQITKIMDSAVILMEGGTIYDLQVLDESKKEATADASTENDKAEEEGNEVKLEKYDLEVAGEEKPNIEEDTAASEDKENEDANPDSSDVAEKKEEDSKTAVEAVPKAPRALHLTKSVYIRHISPSVKTADILEACQQFTGYLRMALDGPDFEKNYELRGWVTFTMKTNIREVITQLCAIKSSQLTCMANRDLTRRVKHLSNDAYLYNKDLIRADIELASQLIRHLDKKRGLFISDSEEEEESNPLLGEAQVALASIPSTSSPEREDRVDDDNDEEEEGSVHDDSDKWSKEGDGLLQINDSLLWYLRIVHSVDYYGGSMISQEHNMPHRCGIITARPAKPNVISVQSDEVATYLESTKKKITPFMEETTLISDNEAENFGKKDVDSEIEKFIADNTKEISKEKFLCPLSGKKFRGPEFVRKHIFNKHASKLEEVKQQVEFFHNYLYDPARPMPLNSELLLEEPLDGGFHSQPPPDFVPWGSPHMMMFRRGMFPQRGFDMFTYRGRMRRRGSGGFGGRGRRIVEYHDLDAPADMEF